MKFLICHCLFPKLQHFHRKCTVRWEERLRRVFLNSVYLHHLLNILLFNFIGRKRVKTTQLPQGRLAHKSHMYDPRILLEDSSELFWLVLEGAMQSIVCHFSELRPLATHDRDQPWLFIVLYNMVSGEGSGLWSDVCSFKNCSDPTDDGSSPVAEE